MKIFARMDDGRELELVGALGKIPSDSILFFKLGGAATGVSQQEVDAIQEVLAKLLVESGTAPDHPIPVMFVPLHTEIGTISIPKDDMGLVYITLPDGVDPAKFIGPSWLPDNIGMLAVAQGATVRVYERPTASQLAAAAQDNDGVLKDPVVPPLVGFVEEPEQPRPQDSM